MLFAFKCNLFYTPVQPAFYWCVISPLCRTNVISQSVKVI